MSGSHRSTDAIAWNTIWLSVRLSVWVRLRREPCAWVRWPRKVSEVAGPDAVLVTDVGQNQLLSTRYFNYCKPRSIITSGGLGTMGFGLLSMP